MSPMSPRRITRVTRRDVLATIAMRWFAQYGPDFQRISRDTTRATTYDKLAALDPATASREDYDKIIGNTSWSKIECDACNRDVDEAAEITSSYDDVRHLLCADCLRVALAILSPAATVTL